VNIARSILCVLMLSTMGCWLKPMAVSAPVVSPAKFSETGQANLQDKWWRSFNDPSLNVLVERAIGENFTLRSAWARLNQARALARKAGSERYPSLNGTAGASRSAIHTNGQGGTTTGASYSLGLAASYEVDVWGRVAATVEAAERDVDVSRQDLRAAAITLSADVALTWFRLVEQTRQLTLLDEQVKTNTDSLELITLRFRAGQVGGTDVLQQKQTLERTQGARQQVLANIKTYRHQLALLTGQAPGAKLPAVPKALPATPALPATGVPSACFARRPDVKAAELSVASADRSVAAALADRYPKISLSVSASTDAQQVRDLFDNWAANLAANLIAPILDGGRREAEVDRQRARLEERLNGYAAKVLQALREVEDALVRERHQRDFLVSLDKQLRLSKQSTNDIRENYLKGAMSFLRYLTTLLQHQELQRSVLRSELTMLEYRISLYRALSGGWDMPDPPAPKSLPANPQTK
jgi:NodT family efflux transporter outer membrane factor (OMF) lipoprotein